MAAEDFVIMVTALLGLVILLALYLYSFRYILRYSLQDGILRIRLFGSVTVRKIPLSEIEDAQVISWKEVIPGSRSFRPDFLFAERWGGYMIGKGVGIKKHTGLIRRVIISPEDPEGFAERIKAQLRNRARTPKIGGIEGKPP